MALGIFRRASADQRCSFCGVARQAAEVLVAGAEVSICERCLVMSVSLANGSREGFHRFELLLRAVGDALEILPREAPPEEAKALGEAAVALAMGDGARLGVLAGRALGAGRFRAALRILEAVPDEERDPVWAINCVLARHGVGDYRGAFELADATPDPRFLHGALLRLRRVAARLHVDPAPDEGELLSLLAELDRVDRELDLHPTDEVEGHRRSVAAARAGCHLARGEPKAAIDVLRATERDDALTPEARLTLGDALAAAGDPEAARGEWQRAEADGYPESVVPRDARERLGRPESPYR